MVFDGIKIAIFICGSWELKRISACYAEECGLNSSACILPIFFGGGGYLPSRSQFMLSKINCNTLGLEAFPSFHICDALKTKQGKNCIGLFEIQVINVGIEMKNDPSVDIEIFVYILLFVLYHLHIICDCFQIFFHKNPAVSDFLVFVLFCFVFVFVLNCIALNWKLHEANFSKSHF